MADFTAKNTVVMELEQRMPAVEKSASGEGDESVTFEPRTSDMERIVLHKELPVGRTCVPGADWVAGRDDADVQGHQELLHVRSFPNHA
eukprot:4214929-Heterocapsa_arctica.AAC.1